jgi:predicted alpha/beta-fold hydrolase
MPVLPSDYQSPFPLQNRHLQTIYPSLFRKVKEVSYERERVFTPDGDFLDLDWSRIGSRKLLLVLHGLEGSSDSGYARGLVKAFNQDGWDGLALNFRSCSGEPNRLPRFYHSGETSDPAFIIQRIAESGAYDSLALAGFSLGGNVALKYLGERGHDLPAILKVAITFSVPIELHSASEKMAKGFGKVYTRHFLKMLMEKARAKAHLFPQELLEKQPKNFMEFDDWFTGPLHGFSGSMDYYLRSSSRQFLPNIQLPTLLLSAQDDPFLSDACYPIPEAKFNPQLFLEMPQKGGHVGFIQSSAGLYWSEQRALQFVREVLGKRIGGFEDGRI